MRVMRALVRDERGAASAELIFVTPMLIIMMFGSMELGNYFMLQHAVTKHVRDGARYASRLTLANPYSCSASPSTVFQDPDAATKIVNVTKTGSVDGSAFARFPSAFWVACPAAQGQPANSAVAVSIRCVNKGNYAGIYASMNGQIPVVSVTANVDYQSLFGTMGFDAGNFCMRATNEVAVAGL